MERRTQLDFIATSIMIPALVRQSMRRTTAIRRRAATKFVTRDVRVRALEESRDGGHAGADDSEVDFDVAPDCNGVVVPGHVEVVAPDGEGAEA